MAEARVANRYVKSLLPLAVEQDALEAVHKDMLLITNTCNESRDFRMMLRSPVIRHEVKRAVLKKVFTGKINKLTLAIIDMLTKKNREPLLPAIAVEFHNAYNVYKGISKASITTTVPMDKDIRTAIESLVKKLSGKKEVEMAESVDANLIGGFVLHVGDRQIDTSIRSKLKSLSLKFNEDYFAK